MYHFEISDTFLSDALEILGSNHLTTFRLGGPNHKTGDLNPRISKHVRNSTFYTILSSFYYF